MLNRYNSEKPKGRASKSKEGAKGRVGRARSKKEAMGALSPTKFNISTDFKNKLIAPCGYGYFGRSNSLIALMKTV